MLEIRDGKLELYLCLKECETSDYTVKCEAFALRLNGEKRYYDSFKRSSYEYKSSDADGYGLESFIDISEICTYSHQYLKNDTLTLGMKVNLLVYLNN